MNILLVDDNPDILEILQEQFVEYDFLLTTPAIETADDGKTAVPQLSKTKFDLIITDFMMPGMNGLEFIKTVREGHTQNKNSPVICISAFLPEIQANTPTHILEGVYFIEKPFDPDKVARVAKMSLLKSQNKL
ncbi:MAG: response regulator [Oligoflexales bacterium]